jgi:hypothetical protein
VQRSTGWDLAKIFGRNVDERHLLRVAAMTSEGRRTPIKGIIANALQKKTISPSGMRSETPRTMADIAT